MFYGIGCEVCWVLKILIFVNNIFFIFVERMCLYIISEFFSLRVVGLLGLDLFLVVGLFCVL